MDENPLFKRIISLNTPEKSQRAARYILNKVLLKRPHALKYIQKKPTQEMFSKLSWSDYALIRMNNYLKYAGQEFVDLNSSDGKSLSDPLKMMWLAYHKGLSGAKSYFFRDAIFLFRQAKSKKTRRRPTKEEVLKWMSIHPSGRDEDIKVLREENKKRIIRKFIELQNLGFYKASTRFELPQFATYEEKFELVNQWWDDYRFHLRFAIRDYKTLDFYLDNTLSPKKLEVFHRATEKGLPFFINFYYLSLLIVNSVEEYVGADMPIRDYIFYNKDLINEFGSIVAWEKEDKVEAGKPNAAGWLLPNDRNIHRRYPETAIFIPDTMGRSCGGLCVSCQRMYDFQKGHLNFNLEKLAPAKSWNERLVDLLKYYEKDTHLRDILITGGDSFMSSNNSLKHILDEVYQMIVNKNKANQKRKEGEKYAPIERVRLGTRLPVYIPQRIDEELISILSDFKKKASRQGVKQFVIQTHFVSAMEITPEAEKGVQGLLNAGWMVTNQAVFTTSVSRKGHVAKLRSELNKIGVLSYYTFSVKGFRENRYNFATNARIAQELFEEKVYGKVDDEDLKTILNCSNKKAAIQKLMKEKDLPFLATDRSVMNMPALGKSLTFSVIGITYDGRRVLRFRHDSERKHSPIVSHDDDVIIVESKSVNDYIMQLEKKGEVIDDYENLYGYSLFATERRKNIFSFEMDDSKYTKEYNNFRVPEEIEY